MVIDPVTLTELGALLASPDPPCLKGRGHKVVAPPLSRWERDWRLTGLKRKAQRRRNERTASERSVA